MVRGYGKAERAQGCGGAGARAAEEGTARRVKGHRHGKAGDGCGRGACWRQGQTADPLCKGVEGSQIPYPDITGLYPAHDIDIGSHKRAPN